MDRADTGGVPLKLEILCLVSIFLFVAFAGTYKLKESPGVWYDEGYVLQASKNLALTGKQQLQLAPDIFVSAKAMSIGFPVLAPLALSYKIFGFGLLQARYVMALYILAFCAAAYALARGLFGPRTALLSLLAVSSYASLYGNGRSALGEVPGLFFLMLTLYFLHRLEKSGYTDVRMYALSGLAAGLCVATKPNFILLYPAIGVVYLLRYRSIPLRLRGLIVGIIVFLATIALWIHTQFGTDSSFIEVWKLYVNPYEVANPFAHALENLKRYFTELTPFYTLALVSVWGVALYVRQKVISSAELVAFVFCLIVMLQYLRLAEWYRYFFQATMVALVFLAPSVTAIYYKCGESLRILRKFPWLPSFLIATLFAMQVFQLFTTSYVAGYFNSTRTHDLETYVSRLPIDASVYFYNVTEAVFFAPGTNYYQYIWPHPTYGILGTETLPRITDGDVDYIVMTTGAATNVDMSKYQPIQQVNRYTILKKK